MMKNLVLFSVFTITIELMLANTIFGYPGLVREENKQQPVCPQIDKGLATLLPHESICTAYYMCQSGEAIMKTCPHELHFNPKKKVCDFPERAGCTSQEEEEKEIFSFSAGIPHADCQQEDTDELIMIPHESECSKFYMCRHGLAYEKTCLYDLHFNPKLSVCDYPENVNCDLKFSKKEASRQPICPRVNKDVATLLPHETDCTQYYICESGAPILRFCPDELHFNPKKRVCDFPERAGCQEGEHHPVQLAAPEATGSPSPFCPMINGKYPIFFPHETNCSIFYMCGNGLAYEKVCPNGLHFNIRLKTCDYPWRAKCKAEGFQI